MFSYNMTSLDLISNDNVHCNIVNWSNKCKSICFPINIHYIPLSLSYFLLFLFMYLYDGFETPNTQFIRIVFYFLPFFKWSYRVSFGRNFVQEFKIRLLIMPHKSFPRSKLEIIAFTIFITHSILEFFYTTLLKLTAQETTLITYYLCVILFWYS